MRVLVFGASGLVGSHILGEALRRHHDVQGTCRTFLLPGLTRIDLGDDAAVRALLVSFDPTWVVHAAGWTWVDGCERDPMRAMQENCEQPVRLARMCHERGYRFAYFSSTYVFNGEAGPYSEDDEPCPSNVYGLAKRNAEQQIQETLGGLGLLLRTICVWGVEPQKKNFAYQILNAVLEQRPLRLPMDQRGNPTWAGDIAAWTVSLMETGAAGVWHLAGRENLTRTEWAEAILAGLRRTPGFGNEVDAWRYDAVPTAMLKQAAPRPLNSGANTAKICNSFPRVTRAASDLDI